VNKILYRRSHSLHSSAISSAEMRRDNHDQPSPSPSITSPGKTAASPQEIGKHLISIASCRVRFRKGRKAGAK